MASNAVASGPTADRVAKNIERVRKARQLNQKDVSALLKGIGRRMLPTVISKMERGERRIDVDDLVALALVLNVSPLTLLLPDDSSQEPVCLADDFQVQSRTAWQWAEGHRTAVDFAVGPIANYGPDGDPAVNAEVYESEQEFTRKQTAYKALVRPQVRQRAANHPAVRLLRELGDLVEDIVEPESGVDRAALAARARMAQRRYTQLGLELEEITEKLPPVHPGVSSPALRGDGQNE
jgi:transcriptional regulator with XRE-family HTH domain